MRTLTAERDPAGSPRVELDASTLDSFVRAHYGRLAGLARLVCTNPDEAGDAVQAALEQAWRRRTSLRDPTALRSWLDRIVVREAIRLDRRRRSPLGRLLGSGGREEVPTAFADNRADYSQTMTELRIAYEALPAHLRAVLALHLHIGYSVAETAQLVDAPVETVRSRLRIGRERLRRLLEDGS